MSPNYNEISVIPNHRVDQTTGELHPITKNAKDTTSKQVVNTLDMWTSHTNIYLARQVCWNFWEDIVKEVFKKHILTWWIKNQWFDISFVDESPWEIKTWRAWNRCIIIESQLEKMPGNWYYCLVFYKINKHSVPTEALQYAQDNLKSKPESYLKKQLRIHSMYIFPRSDIVYFFNHPKIRKYTIKDNKRWQPTEHYVWVGVKNAKKIFTSNPWNLEQTSFSYLSSKWAFPVYVSSFPEIML